MPSDRDNPAGDRTETGESERVIPESDDQGKDVVDTGGQEIGMVADVEGDTMHVDPHPSVTESIKSKLGAGTKGGGAFPVSPEFVERIGDDVVLDVERDEEFQEETR